MVWREVASDVDGGNSRGYPLHDLQISEQTRCVAFLGGFGGHEAPDVAFVARRHLVRDQVFHHHVSL